MLHLKTESSIEDKSTNKFEDGKMLIDKLKSCKELKRWERSVSPFDEISQKSRVLNNYS